MGKIIGIDLGTTNSCVAVMEGGKPVVVTNAEGSRTTPSVVAFTKSGERLIGDPAKRQAVTNASRTISSVKRYMGTDHKIMIDERAYTPQEISAMILQKLKADAESYLGEKVTEAVITVPAYFNDAQRQATKDAGRIAGLDVKRIINEPTAAALAYGLDEEKEQKLLVYDLGGGTFDVSVIEISDGVIEVLSTNGDTHLGGDDYDEHIVNWIIDEFKRMERVDLSHDNMAMQRIRESAEKAKRELSSASMTTINLPFITATAEGAKHLDLSLTRAKFNELTADLTDRTTIPVKNALKDADISSLDLGKVLLVGGSTRMISVQEKVKVVIGKDPSKELNPDECVAIGAAIQGGKIAGEAGTGEILLLDVTPLTLSIETMGGVSTPLIKRNTTIPTTASQVFSTAADNQTAVDIHVVQGEREFVKDNKTLGRFRLDGILPARRGVPQIEVTFDIDANGIVNVSAKDKGTGREQRITITSGSNMSQADIERAIKEAQAFAAADKAQKEAIDNFNIAQGAASSIEQNLKDLEGKIAASEKMKLEAMIKEIKDITNHQDIQTVTPEIGKELKEKADALTEEAQNVFASVYQNNYTKDNQPKEEDSDTEGSDDEVIYGKFKEV